MEKGNYVPGVGYGNSPDLMFVAEAPGQSEDFMREPLVGPTGQLLDSVFQELGIRRNEVYLTNVIKFRPPDNKLKRLIEIGVDIDQQINQLWEEINAVKPKCIVGLGNLPLKAVFGKGNGFKGIMKYRGSPLKTVGLDFYGVPTIHPAALLHAGMELEDGDENLKGKKKGPIKYSYRHIMKLDIMKAMRISKTYKYAPPERHIEICRDHVQLQRFLDLYKDKEFCAVDIEVVKSIPFCIALAFNEWHAISIPLIDIFSWQNLEGIPDHVLAAMWKILADFLAGPIKVVGQNFKFDQGQLARLCGIFIKNFYCDTSLLAHSLHPEFPKALEFTTSIYTDQAYYKDEGKEFDWRRDKIDRHMTYNGRDACITFEVFWEMMKDARSINIPGFPNWTDEFVLDRVMKNHWFYYDLENVGFAVDHPRKKQLSQEYGHKIDMAQGELDALAGWSVNVSGSSPDPKKLLFEQLKFPYRGSTGEDTLYALMGNHCQRRPAAHKRILELILLIRRLKLNKKKVFDAECDYDGRMRTVYTIAGTETGRSNTKVLKPPVRPFTQGMPFQTITKHGDVGAEAREFLIADSGYVIIETDMSQAEARIVALLARDDYMLDLFNRKADIHSITSTWIFGVDLVDVTKELRFIGKTCRHAGNYDMGKKRLAELVNTDATKYGIDISISEYKAGIILDKFHSRSPNIRGVFHKEIQAALQSNGRVLVNPFGRYRQFFDRWGRELWKEAYAQIPQSTVPDHLRGAGIRTKERLSAEGIDARFVVEAHDALVAIVKEKDAESYTRIIEEEIASVIDFSRCTLSRGKLIIPAESKIGRSYKTCGDKKCKSCKFLHDYKAAA